MLYFPVNHTPYIMPFTIPLPISFLDHSKSFEENKESFLKYGLIYKHFPEEGLYVLKYNKNKADTNNAYIGMCRGLVLCDKTNIVVSVPPRKSVGFPQYSHIITNNIIPGQITTCEEFIEGTNINVFYHNDTWKLSTRSTVGANTSYDSDQTFRELFFECLDFSLDNLDKQFCYNFVFQHPDNRQIIPITENKLYLVGAYKIEENQIQQFTSQYIQAHLKETCNVSVSIPKTFHYDNPLPEIADIARNLAYTEHGIMFTTGQLRSKVLADRYMFIRALKGDTNRNNLMERYLVVMKNKMIKQYLIHFPEVKEQFQEYTRIINEIIDNLHGYYYQCFIERAIKHNEMPFVYKPLAFQIHKHFLETKVKTTRKIVEEYIKSRDVQQLLFIIDNLDRQSKGESESAREQ
jgi:hypothetical protein